jgi:hypothetical protein
MSLSLLILGVFVTLAGAAMLAFGVSNNSFDLGNTLIIAGTTAFVGGLILIALSDAARQLRRISESLMARPVGRVPRANDLFEPVSSAASPMPAAPRVPFPPKPGMRDRVPAPAPPFEPRPDVAPAEDRFDRPPPPFVRAKAPEPPVIPEHEETSLSPQPEPEPRFAAARDKRDKVDDLSEELLATAFSRLDVSLRPPPPAAEPPNQNELFESLWPADPRKASDAEAAEAAEYEQPAEEPEQPESYAVSILKSGVVDGMAYTLYSDGSIEAEMPQGTMRFASITELRAYLEKPSS